MVIFDKAYVDFTHLADLSVRDVFWVTRAKDNLRCRVVRRLQHGVHGNILRDDLIVLTSGPSASWATRANTPGRSLLPAWLPQGGTFRATRARRCKMVGVPLPRGASGREHEV